MTPRPALTAEIEEAAKTLYLTALHKMPSSIPAYRGQGEEIAEFQFKEGFREGYYFALAALASQEKRRVVEAKVRAQLVEALEVVKASWTNNDPLRAQHILQINDALASAKLLA